MENNKIGIITYHFAANYGAVLQCYALNQCLKMQGFDSSVINYITDKQSNNNSLYRSINHFADLKKNLMLLPFHILRKRRMERFNQFLESCLKINIDIRLKSLSELQSHIEQCEYKYVVSGSDQVWNPEILDFDDAFFYPFNSKARKVGYAISTGGAKVSSLVSFTEYIESFSQITVREKSTAEILHLITSKTLTEVCDPVFLLPKEQWITLANQRVEHNYLLCYFIKTNEIDKKIDIAKEIAKKRNLKLIILSARITKYNFIEKVYSDCGPKEFLSFFYNADYICTDSFHGTAFSLIFNKQFVTLERKSEKNDGRKSGLLKNVGAQSRGQFLDDKINDLCELDYNKINKRICQMRESSLSVLLSMLS